MKCICSVVILHPTAVSHSEWQCVCVISPAGHNLLAIRIYMALLFLFFIARTLVLFHIRLHLACISNGYISPMVSYLHAATSFVVGAEPTSTASAGAILQAISINELSIPTPAGASLLAIYFDVVGRSTDASGCPYLAIDSKNIEARALSPRGLPSPEETQGDYRCCARAQCVGY